MSAVLAEHLEYISDRTRLARFREAISRTVRPGERVADVGCGFGVLGLICLQAGAARVWGIDSTDAIEIARETTARAGLEDRYCCIREHSFRATLPESVDLIVCDHVGFFGIDYGIIEMVGDARRRFLKPGGRIMPARIRLMLAAAASPEARAKAEAWSAPAIPIEYHWLRQYGINTKQPQLLSADDIRTAPALLGTIDLSVDNPDHFAFQATLRVSCGGALDGLAGWFECELADGVWMNNSPLADDRIERAQAFLPFDTPIEVAAGDDLEISLTIRHDPELIAWTVRDPRTGRRQKQSGWGSRILSEADRSLPSARVPQLSRAGIARKIVLGYADGVRSAEEIEHAVMRDHPDLLPSREELGRFVRGELAKSTEQ